MPLLAWLTGLWRVIRAPGLLAGVYALTLGLTVPLGVVLHMGLPSPLDVPRGEAESGAPPDMDWLDEVTARAGGLTGTLSPEVIGVAGPLTNLSAILDGRRPHTVGLIMSAAYFVVWAGLWGGVIHRLARNRAMGPREFALASRRSWMRLIQLGAIGLAAYLFLFLTVHAFLFGPLYEWVTTASLERTAFAWRAGLSLLFAAGLASASQVLDYARIDAVLHPHTSAAVALTRGVAFVRQRPIAVALLVLAQGVSFVALLGAYGAFEFVPGGSVPRLWRVIVIGQGYIVARLALRLWLAAAQVSLYQRVTAEATSAPS